MTQTADELERELASDIATLGDRLVDEQFCSELYRALASNAWSKRDGPDGHVSLSWRRAEEIVNGLRDQRGEERLTLAQTGGEGRVSDLVAGELGGLGWTSRTLNTDRHDPDHVEDPRSAPPEETSRRRDAPES